MDSEKQGLKEELLAKFGKEVDEILAKPMVTLEEMEDAVAEAKARLGRELLEKVIKVKKTLDKKRP